MVVVVAVLVVVEAAVIAVVLLRVNIRVVVVEIGVAGEAEIKDIAVVVTVIARAIVMVWRVAVKPVEINLVQVVLLE